MPEPRIIKRYTTRKLYDTQSSQYVTLEQIALMSPDVDASRRGYLPPERRKAPSRVPIVALAAPS